MHSGEIRTHNLPVMMVMMVMMMMMMMLMILCYINVRSKAGS